MATSSVEQFRWQDFQGVLFDLDGVITPTAEIHEKAWCELFAPWDCTIQDYFDYIDGKPRYEGVESFLSSRDVSLPFGSIEDAPGEQTVGALGNKKNDIFTAILHRDGIAGYPGSLQTLELLEAENIPSAIVSSSKNAPLVLQIAGLSERFPIVVDGNTVAEKKLNGKPAPDAYLLGAKLLGVDPAHTIVVEDAISGVQAGAAGNFGAVLGVDRGTGAENLLKNGATLTVKDLDELL